MYNVAKKSISNKCCSFELSIHQLKLKTNSTNILCSTTVVKIDHKKCYL